MNPITAAMGLGYATEEILRFLVRNGGKQGKAIEAALQQGYTPDQVIDFVSKEFEGKAYTNQAKRLQDTIEGAATGAQKKAIAELRSKREQKLGRVLGGIGLAAVGAFAASKIPRAVQAMGASNLLGGPGGAAAQGMPLPGAGPQGPTMGGGGAAQAGSGQGTMAQIMQAYQKHLARGGKLSLKSFMQTAAKTVMGNAMGAMSGGQQQPQASAPMQPQQEPVDVTAEAQWNPMGGTEPPVQPGQPMPGAQAPTQPMPMEAQEPESPPLQEFTPSISPEEAAATLESMKLVTKVDNLLQAGNDPEAIKAMINFQLSPGQKKWLADQKLDINQVLDGYLAKPSETSETLPKQPTESVEEAQPKPLASGSTVMLPNGVTGTVTGIEGNKVRITDSEGNKKVAPIEHALQPSPMAARFTQAEADDEIARYNASLDPLEKSAPLLYVAYDPGLQQMNVRWGSSPEQSGTYTNVSPETAKKVRDRITVNKTSGVTGEGVEWKQGEIGKYGSAVFQHVKSVLDESGALLHPYSVGEVIYNRHERADEAVARANTGKTRAEREEGRAKRAAKAAEKAEKSVISKKGSADISPKKAREYFENNEIPEGWYVHGRSGSQELRDDAPIQMTKDWDVAKHFGNTGSIWMIKPKKDANVFDFTSEKSKDIQKIVDKLHQQHQDGLTNQVLDDIESSLGQDDLSRDDILEVVMKNFALEDGVDTAGAFDNYDWIEWLYGNFSPDFVITPSIAVALNKDMVDAVKVKK